MMGYGPSPSHRCDEFPAEYSSASCSPAELASASSATLMLQPITFVRRANLSERQPGNFLAVSLEGAPQRQGKALGNLGISYVIASGNVT